MPAGLSSGVQPLVILYVIADLGRVGRSPGGVQGRGNAMAAAWTERNPGGRNTPISKTERQPVFAEPREAVLEELSRHPSVLGRLVAIAAFRDEHDGVYRHKLAAQFGNEEM